MVVDQPVQLVAYVPSWPARAAAEAAVLDGALGAWLDGAVEHVGSTAVPGLEAKPTIDLMAPVVDLDAARAAFGPLAELGYVYAPHRPHCHWFCKPSPAVREFHLILIESSHPDFAARLRFRDRLRADPATAAAYVDLKRDLAARFRDHREAYTDAKAAFVAEASA
ncbi:MAG: GrpB family protein [Thermoleophilaceae bacterium]